MIRTSIFLDVDGVINALSTGYPRQNTGWQDWKTAYVSFKEQGTGDSTVSALLRNAEPPRGFRITYSPQLLRRIEALAVRDDVEVVWLTTWCNDARTHLCPKIGLDGTEWRVLGENRYLTYRDTSGWWKLNALRDHWASEDRPGQRLVWLDDDLNYERNAREWVAALREPSLGITPDSLHGLSVKHMDAVEAFCDR